MPRSARPRRAGVSSFGLGGSNAHVILEEPPLTSASDASHRKEQLLVLSAKTETALEKAADRLAEHLEKHGESLDLSNVAFTLQHFGQTALHFGDRQHDVLTFHTDRVPDLCEHIGDRVGHHGAYDSFTNWPS